jgi:chemotaxis protein methyltransferase CheR
MTPADFDFVAQLLKRRSGLVLGGDKLYLLESRLGSVARKHGLAGLAAIVFKLKAGDEPVARDVTDAMTAKETFFFRDKTPFQDFENSMLPALLKARAGSKRLRIWCAGASTGQEPYSLAMILREKQALVNGWRVEIVGSDLSGEVLTRAKTGFFSHFEVQRGLPIRLLVKHFAKERGQWRINGDVRSMVEYRQINLLDSFVGLGNFDIIYCRNVLSSFDEATRRNVLERLAQLLPGDGYLVLGTGETSPVHAAQKVSVA